MNIYLIRYFFKIWVVLSELSLVLPLVLLRSPVTLFIQVCSVQLSVHFLIGLFSGGWSQSSQIQPIYWCWRHNLFRRTSLQVGTDNTAPVYNICLEFLGWNGLWFMIFVLDHIKSSLILVPKICKWLTLDFVSFTDLMPIKFHGLQKILAQVRNK